jgi:hypothetical protein
LLFPDAAAFLVLQKAQSPTDRAHHAVGTRDSLPRKVEGSAVVHGRAHEREAEGHVYGFAKPEQFDRS